MLRAVADTHAVIWFLYGDPRLSKSALALIDEAATTGDQIGVSAVTLAEIVYLSEKGRIPPEALQRLLKVVDESLSVMRELPLDRAVVAVMTTINRDEVPDLPDRIIAATARLYEVPVISRDRQIRLSSVETVW
ncbi:MAG: type II toxin-antitoxin system VapC family toxin [Chloroflexota bacterium]|nr:type II toxin-antitoxin system VapC family toxin [Chloroflexota bacterium]